jgi:glycosyltransferase involved in cell wall biosynthesis
MPKLKIFIIHPSDWLTDHLSIGDGLVAHGFLKELAARGHEIHIAARSAELRVPFPDNVTIHPIPQSIRLRPLDRIEYMLRVRALFRRLKSKVQFDVAHQMNPVFAGLSLALAGFEVPVVLGTYVPDWPDDPDAVTSRRGLAGWFARRLKAAICSLQQSQAAAFLLTSPAARARIFLGPSAEARIHYLGHGIDTTLFSPAPQAESKPDLAPEGSTDASATAGCDSILFLSNLGVKKGIFVLLEAFTDVVAAIPGCRLTIVGGGKESPEIEQIVKQQPWRENVTIHGRIPREDSVAFYRSHTLYTLPSFGEPYATTVLEAMSCGMPVVTTDLGGVPYLILPDGGLAVPARDPSALAAGLVQLLRSPDLARKMGQRNRAKILAENTWKAVVDGLEQVYTQATQRAGVPIAASQDAGSTGLAASTSLDAPGLSSKPVASSLRAQQKEDERG